MKIRSLPKTLRCIKPTLNAICDSYKEAYNIRTNYIALQEQIRSNYNSIIAQKKELHNQIHTNLVNEVQQNFNHLLSTYFYPTNIDSYNYIRSKVDFSEDSSADDSLILQYISSYILLDQAYVKYYIDNEISSIIKNYYNTYILSEDSLEFDQLDFYLNEADEGNYYNLYNRDYSPIVRASYPKITYMVTGYILNDVTSSDVISVMSDYNELITNYPTDTPSDYVNAANEERNKLFKNINQLRYNNQYNYFKLTVLHNKNIDNFEYFKTNYINYDNYLMQYLSGVYMAISSMFAEATWQNYILDPIEDTVWRADVMNKIRNYVLFGEGFLSALSGSYGENFSNKTNFEQIF